VRGRKSNRLGETSLSCLINCRNIPISLIKVLSVMYEPEHQHEQCANPSTPNQIIRSSGVRHS